MLTPSTNTVLEPVTAAMVAGLPGVSAHFARFRVLEISLGESSRGQFEMEPMLAASDLLADARVHAICWNGTSASWLGLETDRRLCAAITERTGIKATSSVLALVEMFRRAGVERYGLVTPYTNDVQRCIIETMGREGFACVAERHLAEKSNFHFADVSAETIMVMAREVAAAGPQAIVILCTNLDGATLTSALEEETGLMVFDSIATGVWGALRQAGRNPSELARWGRVFRELS